VASPKHPYEALDIWACRPDAVRVMAVGIELQRVRRTSGGRVHLTAHVPELGPVVTLCGQTFAEGTYRATDAQADCRNCLRRKDDAARVSSAFFQSDVGAELLQRSLEQARASRTRTAPAPSPAKQGAGEPEPAVIRPLPAPRPAAPRPDEEVPAIKGLRSRTPLRRTFENVYVSPDGVIVRVSDGAVSHVAFNGPVDVRHRDGVLTVRVGDVVLELRAR
jgi:hypothetical protein